MHKVSSQLVQQLGRAICKGQGVCFVGAGLSVAAGAPSWDELVKPLRMQLLPATKERSNLMLAQFFRNQHGANELYAYLRRKLSVHLEPTPAHEALCSLPVPVFVTTNYDDLLEVTFRRIHRNVHVIRDNDEMALWNERDEVQLLKIHGDLNSAKDIVLTERDYIRFLSSNSLIRNKLAELFCYRNVIFAGYSLRDPNIALIFNAISYELGELKRPAYLITFDTDPHRQKEWRNCGIVPVCLDGQSEATTRTEVLRSLISDIGEEARKENRNGTEVLLVDDESNVRGALERALVSRLEGLRVRTAANGYEALLLMGKFQPQLVIVDLMMPHISGLELIAAMRNDPDLDETKVIVITGQPELCPPEVADRLRIDQVLSKPVPTEKLEAIVRRVLGVAVSYPPLFDSEHPPQCDSSRDLRLPRASGVPPVPSWDR